MSEQERCAYIISQAAALTATVLGMAAENQAREHRGEFPAYGEEAFMEQVLIHGLGCNSVLAYLQGR